MDDSIKHAYAFDSSILCRQRFTLINVTFADRLTLALSAAVMTPVKLAESLGVTVQAVSQVLSGSTKAMTAANCARAARILSVDAYWLATGDGEMRPAGVVQDTMALSEEERDFIIAMRVLDPRDRLELVAQLMAKAASQVAHLEALLGRQSERSGPALAQVLPIRR
jgi:transcriptional regulator with XRE-family HTH domain